MLRRFLRLTKLKNREMEIFVLERISQLNPAAKFRYQSKSHSTPSGLEIDCGPNFFPNTQMRLSFVT